MARSSLKADYSLGTHLHINAHSLISQFMCELYANFGFTTEL